MASCFKSSSGDSSCLFSASAFLRQDRQHFSSICSSPACKLVVLSRRKPFSKDSIFRSRKQVSTSSREKTVFEFDVKASTGGGGILSRLPAVKGKYQVDFPLHKLTWFGVGGNAEVFFQPEDVSDLQSFLTSRPSDVPLTVIGVGSNLLVRDGGVRGVVVRLGKLTNVHVEPSTSTVVAGAGALDLNVSKAARDAGISGFEFMSGIPGTIGGALRMNAGAYGSNLAAVLEAAKALSPDGEVHEFSAKEMQLGYRECLGVPKEWMFIEATMRGQAGDKAAIQARMDEITAKREETQPIKSRTGGSTFRNPDGFRAWELVEEVGGRGLRLGGAMISDQHCNFLLNTGNATAADIEGLGEEIRRRVLLKRGIDLHWEIERIGDYY